MAMPHPKNERQKIGLIQLSQENGWKELGKSDNGYSDKTSEEVRELNN